MSPPPPPAAGAAHAVIVEEVVNQVEEEEEEADGAEHSVRVQQPTVFCSTSSSSTYIFKPIAVTTGDKKLKLMALRAERY